jgi:hypothetical protein
MQESMLNWPEGFERTPPEERETVTKFSKSYRGTKSDLKREMERLGVESWALDDVSGSSTDPGVVMRWRKDETDYAVACDAYTSKTDNLRATYLWLNETRMRNQRPVETGQDQLAAAQLPSKDADVAAEPQPHVVLGVEPDADKDAVMDAFRTKVKDVHPDYGGSEAAFRRVKRARDKML